MSRYYLLVFLMLCFIVLPFKALSQEHSSTHPQKSPETVQNSPLSNENEDASESVEMHKQEHGAGEEGHESDMSPLFFICIALFIGTATRHYLRKSPLPYTVSMLLIGIGIGILERLGYLEKLVLGGFSMELSLVSRSIEWAGSIDPHLIFYVFLPTLIFEAAFALDVHTFKKTSGNAFIMAVPGLIVALFMTAGVVMLINLSGLGLLRWDWIVALLFGTIATATDPVAVVALLKELGAGKKLQTFIESESLLNDGSAIVIFTVFLALLTGEGSDANPLVQFLQVALGGILIGAVIGWIIITLLKRVYNDALFEITIIVAAAYLTFFVAEKLHVSGVLGVVMLGLLMAGVGRTRISPQVHHFLHEFWELAAFIANTLIFLIVGVIIAQRTHFTGNDILILFLIYIAIIVIRAFVIMIFYPLMRRIGYGLPVKHGIVAWWGGLRGAIGLALALIVAGVDTIDPEIRDQILFLTAGIVFLTSTINATTTKWLVKMLGITKMSSAKELMLINTQKIIHQGSEKELSKIKNDRFMAGANWEKVKEYIPEPADEQREQELEIETLAETRKRILQKEKSSYWKQFEEGLLGRVALQQLSDTIDIMMDSEGNISLSKREDLENLWQTPKLWNKLQLVPVIGRFAQNVFFNKLSMSYDCARGLVAAQEETLKMVSSMAIHAEDGQTNERYEIIESEINENRIQGLTFLRNLRESYPEIYSAIETRQAIRTLLNHQEYSIERLLKQRRIEPDEAEGMLADIEEKMAKLLNTRPGIKTKLPVDLLRNIPWLAALDEKNFKKVLGSFQSRIYAVGENLVRKKRYGDDIFIIIRGSVKVIINKKVVDVLGPGDVLGEMSILAGITRTATVTAESPVTALRLSEAVIFDLMKESEPFKYQLWLIAARRFTENLLERIPPYTDWSHQKIRAWLQNGEIKDVPKGEGFDLSNKLALLLYGQVVDAIDESKVFDEMRMVDSPQVKIIEDARFFLVEKP